eukprot:g2664.t1
MSSFQKGGGEVDSVSLPVHAKSNIIWIKQRSKARKLLRDGELARAVHLYEQIIRTHSGLRDAALSVLHLEVGDILRTLGDSTAAMNYFKEAKALTPSSHRPFVHMSQVSIQLGELLSAIKHLNAALFYAPDDLVSLNNMGSLLYMIGQPDEGDLYFQRVAMMKELVPPSFEPMNWSLARDDGHHWITGHVLAAFDSATSIPNYNAIGHLRRFFELSEEHRRETKANSLFTLSEVLHDVGLYTESQASFDVAHRMVDEKLQTFWLLRGYLRVPRVLTAEEGILSLEEAVLDSFLEGIAAVRRIFEGRTPMQRTLNDRFLLDLRITEILTDVRNHLSSLKLYSDYAMKLGGFLRELMPTTSKVAPRLLRMFSHEKTALFELTHARLERLGRTISGSPIRVGIVSSRMSSEFMEGKMTANLLYKTTQRNGGRFHVTLFEAVYTDERLRLKAGSANDGISAVLRKAVDRVVILQGEQWDLHYRRILAHYASDIDILVFVAPAKDEVIFWLAQNRFAPVQVALWAGASTAGVGDTIDYFIFPDEMLSKNAHDAVPAAQLVRLRGLGAYIPPLLPQMPTAAKPGKPHRYIYGGGKVILFAKYDYVMIPLHSLSELHPGLDQVLASILLRSERIHLLLVDHSQRNLGRRGLQRLVVRIARSAMQQLRDSEAKDLVNLKKRIKTISQLPRGQFLSLIAATTARP